jgi:hypothetical protein
MPRVAADEPVVVDRWPARALSDLRKYEAYIKRPAGEFADPPVKAQMLPPIEQYAGRREQIIRHSRDRFGRRRLW